MNMCMYVYACIGNMGVLASVCPEKEKKGESMERKDKWRRGEKKTEGERSAREEECELALK